MKKMITKMTKWLIDNTPNLSPEEKLGQKLMVNEQIADPIDREAENQCDWVDFAHECTQQLVRNSLFSLQDKQQRLRGLHDGVQFLKFQIQQQAEYAKRQRDEQARVRWILSSATPR